MSEDNQECQKDETQPEVIAPRAVLVCGIDIEGSTALKVQNPGLGKSQVSYFLKNFNILLRDKDSRDGDEYEDGWFLWRVRGDELVYFRVIPSEESNSSFNQYIEKYIKEFVETLESVTSTESMGIHGYAFLLHSKGEPWDFSWNLIAKNGVDKTELQIDLEDGMGDPNTLDLLAEEVFSEYKGDIRNIQNDYHIDFIGREVDLGFRIAEHSRPHYFVLSPGLVKCILNAGSKERDILFLGFHELKGCTIGNGGPEKFPLFFIPVKNKDDSLSEEILENYRIFNNSDYGESLKKFEEYERKSCERKYDRFKKKKVDTDGDSDANVELNVSQIIGIEDSQKGRLRICKKIRALPLFRKIRFKK